MRRALTAAAAALVLVTPGARAQDEPQADPLVWVVALGTEQLCATPEAYPEFCENNAARPRSALRRETIARLKEIAKAGRPKLLKALGDPESHRPLWIVNGVALQVPRGTVAALREHEDIRFVYGAGPPPPARAPDTKPPGVATVLEPVEREPFTTKGKKVGWHIDKLGVDKVWKELGVHGEGVVIVSFDNGLNYRQQDLRANVWRNPGETPNDGKDDDGNGLIDDVYGWDFTRNSPEVIDTGKRQHGTLTSCIAVGDGTGGTITGVAPRARLMPIRASGGPYRAALAMQYALEQGGDVLSMSFSIPNLGHGRGLWRTMAEHASAAGLVLVSGSGNFQKQQKVPVQIRIPEGIPCVICVGGVTEKLKLAPFSSMGPVEWESVAHFGDFPMPKGLIKPDVAAFPGPKLPLVGTDGDDTYLGKNNGRRGNSLSAPQVAGVCALMLSANPELPPWRVKAILEETAKDLPPKGKDPGTGAGLVRAFEAVEQAQKEIRAAETPR